MEENKVSDLWDPGVRTLSGEWGGCDAEPQLAATLDSARWESRSAPRKPRRLRTEEGISGVMMCPWGCLSALERPTLYLPAPLLLTERRVPGRPVSPQLACGLNVLWSRQLMCVPVGDASLPIGGASGQRHETRRSQVSVEGARGWARKAGAVTPGSFFN